MKELEGLPKSFIKWFKKRPKVIQEAIIKRPPNKLYKIKSTREQCYILGYSEPDSVRCCGNKENIAEVTMRVQKTGIKEYKDVAEEMLHQINGFKDCEVFGLKLDDLEEWKDL